MLRDLAFILGAVAVVEGLVLALAPHRLEQLLSLLTALGPERMRLIGLLALATGTVLLAWARSG
ncbi:DUF2065 family protein [Oceanomicrobium pacificus]|uniref:DUF2065 family protein n=1 Tax=Oceanomicrobium pacificus TaxID=2692916 RepID=A0A6B0TLX0_9RHOB|nr:DUF2065 family protein [Oceanomicrobium pacificus]MXU65537.1 DUF2065 family protein [Oceanomicrobium pacificus]